MKLCLAEAIKKLKALDDELNRVLDQEKSRCFTVYRNVEEKIVYDYDFNQTREKVKEITDEIVKIKGLIHKANNETKIGVEDYTISDGLIKMALINREVRYHVASLARKEKLTTKVDMRNDAITYEELLYDPEECVKYMNEQNELLSKIQLGIDRANLTTLIEIE